MIKVENPSVWGRVATYFLCHRPAQLATDSRLRGFLRLDSAKSQRIGKEGLGARRPWKKSNHGDRLKLAANETAQPTGIGPALADDVIRYPTLSSSTFWWVTGKVLS